MFREHFLCCGPSQALALLAPKEKRPTENCTKLTSIERAKPVLLILDLRFLFAFVASTACCLDRLQESRQAQRAAQLIASSSMGAARSSGTLPVDGRMLHIEFSGAHCTGPGEQLFLDKWP